MYTILPSKPQLYPRHLVDTALQAAAKYRLQIIKYCRESPAVPTMSAEEVMSDLILERMPRFVVNCRKLSLQEITAVVNLPEEALQAAKDPKKLEYNIASFKSSLAELKQASNKNTLEFLEKKTKLEKQVAYLQALIGMRDVEKKFLAYIRSCVRRTKIKYLQRMRRERGIVHNADPTNGLLEMRDKREESFRVERESLAEVEEMFNRLRLTADERTILRKVIIEGKYFRELGEELGCSRTTAARRYQDLLRRLRNQL